MHPTKNTRRGFTLIELLVVVLIIGILTAVALPQYKLAVAKSQYATYKNNTKVLESAVRRYYLENGVWANNINQLDVDLPGLHLWDHSIFLDSKTAGKLCYIWYNANGNNGYVACGTKEFQYRLGLQDKYQQCYASEETAETDIRTYKKICEMETSRTAPSRSSGDKHFYYDYP